MKEQHWIKLSYLLYVIILLVFVLVYVPWIPKPQVSIFTIRLILFITIVAIDAYWFIKLRAYQEKKYPELYHKGKELSNSNLEALIRWKEVLKNSHPEDKKYSKYIFHHRIVLFILLTQLLSLVFFST